MLSLFFVAVAVTVNFFTWFSPASNPFATDTTPFAIVTFESAVSLPVGTIVQLISASSIATSSWSVTATVNAALVNDSAVVGATIQDCPPDIVTLSGTAT